MNARMRRSAVLAALTLVAAACGRAEAPAAEAAPPVEAARPMETERGGVSLADLDRSVTTARAMRATPGAADSALARAYTESIR